jgi:hypothetical protein
MKLKIQRKGAKAPSRKEKPISMLCVSAPLRLCVKNVL